MNTFSENKIESSTILSDDSDLEDSMHFVDPDDTPAYHHNDKQNQPEPTLEPDAKKPRFAPKTPKVNNNDYLNDCNPQFLDFLHCDLDTAADLNHDLQHTRSWLFKGQSRQGLSRQKARLHLSHYKHGTASSLFRTRSFSEACHRSRHASVGNRPLSTSNSSLLEFPDDSLSNNPFFEDLKSTLLSDCTVQECPQTLLETLSEGPTQDVYARERILQANFIALQSKYPTEISEMSTFYQHQSAEIETERLKEIHGENMPRSFRNHLNQFYDNQLHTIMERVEKSLGLLSSTKRDIINLTKIFKTRPLLSKRAVNMMEEWFQRNYEHPYPSPTAVEALAKAGDITPEQVKKWFANKRNRSKNVRPNNEVANMKRKRQYSARW